LLKHAPTMNFYLSPIKYSLITLQDRHKSKKKKKKKNLKEYRYAMNKADWSLNRSLHWLLWKSGSLARVLSFMI
jgi:hypothetical protein